MLSKLPDTSKVVGTKQLVRQLEAGKVTRVFVAQDADPFITRKVIELSRKHNVPIIDVPTMRELGDACGVDVKTAVAGLIK